MRGGEGEEGGTTSLHLQQVCCESRTPKLLALATQGQEALSSLISPCERRLILGVTYGYVKKPPQSLRV